MINEFTYFPKLTLSVLEPQLEMCFTAMLTHPEEVQEILMITLIIHSSDSYLFDKTQGDGFTFLVLCDQHSREKQPVFTSGAKTIDCSAAFFFSSKALISTRFQ